jgi:hypothetical protein
VIKLNQCLHCYNSEIEQHHNYCKVCGLNLKESAAAGTTAVLAEQLQLIEVRIQRVNRRVTDPEARQQLLAALEARRFSLQSMLDSVHEGR